MERRENQWRGEILPLSLKKKLGDYQKKSGSTEMEGKEGFFLEIRALNWDKMGRVSWVYEIWRYAHMMGQNFIRNYGGLRKDIIIIFKNG
jgi:hypothetical protein